MRKEPYRVTEKEYQFIQQIRNLKEKGFTEEEILQLDRNKEISEEAKKQEKQATLKLNLGRIKHNERAIEYKKDQIKNEVSLEKEESSLDNKKPLFMLQNEIEVLELQNEQFREINKNLE